MSKYTMLCIVAMCALLSGCGGGDCDEQCQAEVPSADAPASAPVDGHKTILPPMCGPNGERCK